ncbi:MAG: cysteine hydrolase family protein [Pseudomonadota bacterium]
MTATEGSAPQIEATPYRYPALGKLCVRRTPLILTGFQKAALAETGVAGAEALKKAEALVGAWGAAGGPVILTRRGRPRGVALGEVAGWRNARRDADKMLVEGGAGWALALEVERAIVVDHMGDNAFLGSDLDHILHQLLAETAVFGGLLTEGTVHATMRAANDRGLDGLLVADAAASTDPAFHATIVSLTTFGNGLFGAVANTADVLKALK